MSILHASTLCPRCSTTGDPDARFCARCGLPLPTSEAGGDTALALLREATLGEYEIAAELGRGGMATVYLAHEIALDRPVAIKLLPPSLDLSAERAERFRQEARIAASLTHPGIVPIYAVKQAGAALFIVMRYVAGRALDEVVRTGGPLPPAEARRVLVQVASALGYAHRRGVVHRDVKPANVILEGDGTAVVTDFGIAKAASADGLTRPGATIGTPWYMSPEQCAGHEVTGASDQYSLGVLGFELLTGRVPFDADTAMSIAWSHHHEPPPSLLDLRADCPPDLAAVIGRMLAKAPEARWATLERVAELLGGGRPDARDAAPAVAVVVAARSRATLRAPSLPGELLLAPVGGILSLGESVHFTAAFRDPAGTRAPDEPVYWSTSDPAVVRVTEEGQVTGVSLGSAVLRAECGGQRAAATLQVTRVGVGQVLLSTPRSTLAVADDVDLHLAVQDGFGSRLGGRVVRWSSSDAAVAAVSRTGRVTARGAGTVEISASTGGHTAAVTLRVCPASVAAVRLSPVVTSLGVGEAVQLSGVAVNAAGRALPGTELTWVSGDPAVARVDRAGLVVALRNGSVRVAAMAGGRRALATVNVVTRPTSRD